MANTYLQRTHGTPTNNRKWTVSYWAKLNPNDTWMPVFGSTYDAGDSYIGTGLVGDTEFGVLEYHGGVSQFKIYSSAKMRDGSAWYHFCIGFDSTQSVEADRCKVYINGELQTNNNDPAVTQNFESYFNFNNVTINVGRRSAGSGRYFDGALAHFHFIDGTQYAASDFGSTDSTTGIWKPRTNPSVTYGNNGFFLKFENASDYGEDSSGNNNDLTSGGGTVTQTIDTPSNVFCTWNPLQWTWDGSGNPPNTSFENANTAVATSASSGDSADVWGTLGVSAGKYYYEIKMTNNPSDSGNTNMAVGWGNASTGERITYYGGNGYQYYASGSAAYGATYTQNDIIGVAVDLTNGTIEFYKNGVSQGSITNRITTNTGYWQPLTWDGSGSLTASWQANFGNGYFGTTAVASAGTNAGIGTFEYDVPSGYKALCTKNINAQEYS